jgi:hypothetical protein
MSFIGTAVLGAGALGAGATIYGASKAADAQTDAATIAANAATNQYNTTSGYLAPYRDIGNQAASQLSGSLASLTAPITMDETTLQNTPGYQFNLTQGLKSTQNSAAARGLGTSGAALKGAATFATGLADSTYQNQFNNAVTNQSNAFNRLSSLVGTGENAAAGTGAAGTAAAGQVGAAATNAGNATAAGYNAIGSGASSLANLTAGVGLAAAKPNSNLFTSSPTATPTSTSASAIY